MRIRNFAFLTVVLGLGALLTLGDSSNSQPPAQPDGVEVLARGPVHEAFAGPTEPRPSASPIVPQPPPQPIQELPPEQRPEGDDIDWIPGYWAFDDEQTDYLWVSGFWRESPPNRTWIPGHWQQVAGGWQWSSGLWAADGQTEIQYVPPPPPSLEAGPSVPALEPTMQYVPGCWVYQQTRDYWRPGFWIDYRPGWVWVPARYVWTPGGCIFTEGYWDYPLHPRGLLFAPVRLARPLLGLPSFVYVPRYTVRHDFMITALFVRPATRCYYFGDYFEDRYASRGFVPWVDYRVGRHALDHNFSYYRHRFGRDESWAQQLGEVYSARRRGDVPRPPQSLVQQNQVVNHITFNKTTNVNVTKSINMTHVENVTALLPLTQVNNTRVTNMASFRGPDKSQSRGVGTQAADVDQRVVKLTPVAKEERAEKEKRIEQVRQVGQQRRQVETKLLAAGPLVAPTDPPKTVKLDLPKALKQRPSAVVPPTASPRPAEKKLPPPPAPVVPKHQDKPIPKIEAPKPSAPPPVAPKKEVAPPVVPKKEAPPPPPKKDGKPAPAPKKEVTPPAPPKKDAPAPPAPKDKKGQEKKGDDKGKKPDDKDKKGKGGKGTG